MPRARTLRPERRARARRAIPSRRLGAPAASWLVTVDPERLIAVRDGGPSPDVSLPAPATSLALLVYGRLELHSARLSIEGDPAVAERFVLIFPRP